MSLLLEELKVPAFCKVCGGLMKGKSTYTHYDYGCCIDCYVFWLEGRPESIKRWKDGWRPSPDEIQRMVEFMKD